MPIRLPSGWCSWESWKQCSVEPCQERIQPMEKRTQKKRQHPSKEQVHKEFCINKSESLTMVLRVPEKGAPEKITPMKERSRICRCQGFRSIIEIFTGKICRENAEHIECRPCSSLENVYTHAQNGEILRPCSEILQSRAASATTSNLYAILGGALGTAAFVAIVLCCVRFFLVGTSRSRAGRRGRGRNANEDGGSGDSRRVLNATGPNLAAPPYQNYFNSELPPAYKDVVPMTAVLPARRADSVSATCCLLSPLPPPPPPVDAVGEVEEEEGEGEGESDEAVNSAPPPSYQDVITFSPSAADMHQRVLAAQGE
ncbi:unnamed protein product [Mesocestoides corti]|uniref:Protein shisa-6 n=1 Tax=Mesocestoides corti TaxID=53468 RepID=A0A0R3UMG7_MESCO|nr:unnamed protein product [Mesocestoides corti]